MNEKVYIHEFIDVIGHHRADYMHHMAANWSPLAQQTRDQRCYGVFAVLGSTGPWPQVVNLWEEDGFAGLAASFDGEAVGAGAQDPALAKWWAKAAEFRRGGFDRIVRPAPWTRTIEQLCADGVRGDCYAHELLTLRAGTAADLLDLVRDHAVEVHQRLGLELVGAFRTSMVDDDEAILLWACPTWATWAAYEEAHDGDPGLRDWTERSREVVTGRHRILLVDAPLSPLRTGRQPSVDDRTDWSD
jgi:hypothetical protein